MRASGHPGDSDRPGLALAALLLAALAVRSVGLDQPPAENYVGRQVPTAMVARNLDRGSGFLNPSLDVAPFPNLFLVEPPVYQAAAVGWRRLTGWPLGASGRFVSALGVVTAAWGLHGLVARRSGRAAGLIAAALFAAFPVTLRYGRAFQPDSLMVGCLVAGLNCWDAALSGRRPGWLAAGVVLTAAGLAMKVVSAYVLVPVLVTAWGRGGRATRVTTDAKPRRVSAGASWMTGSGVGSAVRTVFRFDPVRTADPTRASGNVWRDVLPHALMAAVALVPAAVWYAYAAWRLSGGEGSRASADNGALWAQAVNPLGLLRPATLGHIARALGWRAFTPLGVPLALAGFFWPRGQRPDRLWVAWGVAGLAALACLAAKLHHEYYWLGLAPVVGAGAALALTRLAGRGAAGLGLAVGLGVGVLALDFVFAASTWRTPAEWAGLEAAAVAVQSVVPAGDLVAAPEALLFASDRRGCRVELTDAAAGRAAGEWPADGKGPAATGVKTPADLVDFYAARGARWFADVAPVESSAGRLALHAAVRRRYNVVVDRPGVLIAALDDPPGRRSTAATWPTLPKPTAP